MSIEQIQAALRRDRVHGWLFFDHHRRDPLAYRILGIPANVNATRRWYYFVPADGEPKKLVHRIESGSLDTLPGEKISYSSWSEQQGKLSAMLSAASRIAMQYSPRCAIPYVSLVDAGTIDLIRSFGIEILSSANLVLEFEARWTEAQYQQHLAAGKLVDQARRDAFRWIGERLRTTEGVGEFEVQCFLREHFSKSGLITDHGPIVAVNRNISDPHYEPSADRSSPIHPDDLVLIDLWAKLDQPDAVYYDVTWSGYCGTPLPDRIRNIFKIVRDARTAASELVIQRVNAGQTIAGFEVDDKARAVISERGFGEYFFHRTGHSIGTEVHGTGANMDNLESHDERQILSRTCFSIEPGIYLPDFGIRSEVNVYVGESFAMVTGEQQQEMVLI